MRALVDIDFRKWGDRPHYRLQGERLGHDDAGVWLAVRAGSSYTGPVSGVYENDYLIVVPDEAWWVAAWAFSQQIELYVDVATPALWPSDDHVVTIDLDLDVIRFADGTVVLDDEDEFDEHRVLYSYPDDVVARAEATATKLLDAVRDRRDPFRVAPARWVEALARD